MSDLDRPVWASLRHQPDWGLGDGRARRFRPACKPRRFIGLRIDGRLAAMAGKRMRFPGFVEVSGVCTHPDYRGRGLARLLSAEVAADIQRRGERPFLHAWTTNTAAITLYESLGFEIRTAVNVSVLQRETA